MGGGTPNTPKCCSVTSNAESYEMPRQPTSAISSRSLSTFSADFVADVCAVCAVSQCGPSETPCCIYHCWVEKRKMITMVVRNVLFGGSCNIRQMPHSKGSHNLPCLNEKKETKFNNTKEKAQKARKCAL